MVGWPLQTFYYNNKASKHLYFKLTTAYLNLKSIQTNMCVRVDTNKPLIICRSSSESLGLTQKEKC